MIMCPLQIVWLFAFLFVSEHSWIFLITTVFLFFQESCLVSLKALIRSQRVILVMMKLSSKGQLSQQSKIYIIYIYTCTHTTLVSMNYNKVVVVTKFGSEVKSF